MAFKVMPTTLSDFLKYDDAIQRHCRDTIVVKSGQNLAAGSVLIKDGSNKYSAFDGTGTAVGVLYESVDATGGDSRGVAIVRGPAGLSQKYLVWGGAITDPQKATAIASLSTLGVVTRTTA